MKVICDRGALLESLNLVSGVVVSRTPKPVLTCVKLTAEAGGEGLTLAATDLEMSLRLTTPRVEVSEPGEALVLADKIVQIVRESTDATLTLETEAEATHIRGGDSHFKVFGYPVGDFPPIGQFTGDADFEIEANRLTQLIHQTLYATARENSRYAINGVLMERQGAKLSVVATDGHRLAMAKSECTPMAEEEEGAEAQRHSAIVPTKALQLLTRLLDDSDEPVRVKLAENQILFANESAILATNLVEGNFPPYEDVIPKDGDKKATLKTDAITSAFRRAALLTNEESKGVRMAFTPDGLKLSSRAPEMGEAEVNVELPSYEGEPVEIGFNPNYVLDALKVIDTKEVQFDLKSSNKPGVLRTGPNFLYVVMPVNLQ